MGYSQVTVKGFKVESGTGQSVLNVIHDAKAWKNKYLVCMELISLGM